MTEQDRAEFEAFAATIGVEDFSKGDLYGYSNVLTANCYASWLAARRTQNAQVRELVEAVEGWIGLTGCEDNDEMTEAWHRIGKALAQLKEQDDAAKD